MFPSHDRIVSNNAITKIATKLSDRQNVLRAKAMPYQLLAAYKFGTNAPREVSNAIQDAMEIATENVPAFEGKKVYVFPDVSGSMKWATGTGGFNSKVRAVDIAALFSACILRNNPTAEVIPFDTRVHDKVKLNPRDSVLTTADKLARLAGGGTAISEPMIHLNKIQAKGDLIIYISDNESWRDRPTRGGGTTLADEWGRFLSRNPGAQMVCIDTRANNHSQAPNRPHTLNVGGYSDQVFNVIRDFISYGEQWVDQINMVKL